MPQHDLDTFDVQAHSSWSHSKGKRIFDVAAVMAVAPILFAILITIAFAILITSGSPIFFRQKRVGLGGIVFTIYKFRTMHEGSKDQVIASLSSEYITTLGRFLRRLKLDELPQLFNVLIGDMSLVGPRPRVLEQQNGPLHVRPGITGAATLVFAREEDLFAQIPKGALAAYYREIVLPAKHKLDSEYMQRATFFTDS